MHPHIFALFLQTVYAIEKLLAGLYVQPRIGMNQSHGYKSILHLSVWLNEGL